MLMQIEVYSWDIMANEYKWSTQAIDPECIARVQPSDCIGPIDTVILTCDDQEDMRIRGTVEEVIARCNELIPCVPLDVDLDDIE